MKRKMSYKELMLYNKEHINDILKKFNNDIFIKEIVSKKDIERKTKINHIYPCSSIAKWLKSQKNCSPREKKISLDNNESIKAQNFMSQKFAFTQEFESFLTKFKLDDGYKINTEKISFLDDIIGFNKNTDFSINNFIFYKRKNIFDESQNSIITDVKIKNGVNKKIIEKFEELFGEDKISTDLTNEAVYFCLLKARSEFYLHARGKNYIETSLEILKNNNEIMSYILFEFLFYNIELQIKNDQTKKSSEINRRNLFYKNIENIGLDKIDYDVELMEQIKLKLISSLSDIKNTDSDSFIASFINSYFVYDRFKNYYFNEQNNYSYIFLKVNETDGAFSVRELPYYEWVFTEDEIKTKNIKNFNKNKSLKLENDYERTLIMKPYQKDILMVTGPFYILDIIYSQYKIDKKIIVDVFNESLKEDSKQKLLSIIIE